MAISVGSVEVDVIPSTQGIYQRLKDGLVPAATKAGDDAGRAAGRSFGPAMQAQIADVGVRIGEEIGAQIAARIAAAVRDSLRNGITQGGQTARPAATRQGDETGGAFGRAFKARLEAAFKSLPKADVRLGDTGFNADLDRLRARMQTLSNKRIGVDVDAAVALAEIDKIEADLKRLGAEHPDVNVRVDTGRAVAELVALRAEIARLDGQDVKVDVDTSTASANFNLLTTAALAFGPAILPILPVVAAGLGAVTAAAVSAGVGLGVLAAVAVPAISSIGKALQAQKAAQDASTASTTQGASKALQQAGAQQALAAAHRNAAVQIASAQDQVKQAERGVGDAERSLADSQKVALQAQKDLTQARKDAARQLEDLANTYADAQLSQRDATLSLAEAQQHQREVDADPKSTLLDKQKAALAVDQATQRLKEQTTATARLKDEKAAADKAGVAGSQTVLDAQDKLAKAQRDVQDRAQGVADAHDKVAKAVANVAQAQAQAADSIASAQRQIESSEASAAGSASAAQTAQAKYLAELAKLSPAARQTFDAFVSLRTAFTAWSTALQPQVMPLFTRALEGLKNALPGLTPLVLGAAAAVKLLQDKASAGFKSPWWQTFKQDLATSVGPALIGLGVSFGRIFKGMVGIVDAFLPHMTSISARMQTLTGRFANWGASLRGSPEFERFLAYASKNAPIVSETLRKIARAFLDVSTALGPVSQLSLLLLQSLATGLSWLSTHLPGVVQGMYLLFLATKGYALAQLAVNAALVAYRGLMLVVILLTNGWAAAIEAANLAFEANPVVAVITAIIVVIGLVVAAVVYAYNHWTWFHNAVDAVWHGIAAGASWLWNTILQPVFSAIWSGLQTIGGWAVWLWQNAIKPAWDAIALAARVLFAIILTVLITPLYLAFKLIGGIATWLWENAIKPAWDAIAAAAAWLWDHWLKPYFSYLGDGFKQLGTWATWLWDNAIHPAFSAIADKATWLWDQLRPVFDVVKAAVGKVGDAFGLAKDAIKLAWDKVHDIVQKPVQFIVDTVYNNGIRPVWNAVAKIVKLDELPTYTFATGGILPGYTPGKDVHLAALSGGEAVMRPEWTRAVGPQYVNAMNAAARSGGVTAVQEALGIPGFSDGGILGGLSKVGGWVSSAFSKGVDLAKAGADLFLNPSKAWDSLVKPILSKVAGGVGDTKIGQAVGKLPKQMLDGLFGEIKKAVSAVGSFFGGSSGGGGVGAPAGSGVTRWTPQVIQALAANGLSTSPDMVARILRQIETESGGNERAVQGDIGDINNITGDLAKGLMQTISATFNAYKFPGHGDIFNGYDNLLAALNYAKHRYGPSLSFLGQGHGYDSGGYLQPGMNLAYNGTGRPEPVFTTQQANALVRLAGEPGLGDLSVSVYVGDREITDIARTEVHRTVGGMTQVLGAGRR